ncbi:TCP-1/cpn60 chaperonin family-domain-containing protein [Melanogaster broomeanus]|nr:TCP-1/cpn60 chaperonin family-domain-containing protein [Melanogaster broomeanus]
MSHSHIWPDIYQHHTNHLLKLRMKMPPPVRLSSLIQDVAQKTNEIAGDGTTTTTVLARAIYSESVKNIAQVATISANGDAHVGNSIAQAMEKVGKEGVHHHEIEITEGMRFDRGFISPYFITDVKGQKTSIPSLEAAAQSRRPLVIIAEDIDAEAPAACHSQQTTWSPPGCCCQGTPALVITASRFSATYHLTGGTVFTDELDIKLEKATLTCSALLVLSPSPRRTPAKIRSLLADPSTSEFDKTKLQERLAKLSVGGSSEVEVGEKKNRYEDALNATCAAVEEGILPASLALTTSSPGSTNPPADPDAKIVPTANFDQDLGVNIVRRALTSPARTILSNAGEESSVIVGTLSTSTAALRTLRWYTQQGEHVDMIKAGIVDPLKVPGVVSLLTTSEACVVEAQKEKPAGGMGGGMGGMCLFLLLLNGITTPNQSLSWN